MAMSLSILLFFSAGKLTMFLAFAAAFMLMIFSRQFRAGAMFFSAFAVLAFIDLAAVSLVSGSARPIIGMTIYMFFKFLPVIMMGAWVIGTVRVNDFITAMEHMRTPRFLVIPLAAMLRFMPTVGVEVGYIRDTMRLRNIGISVGSLLLHPLRTMEYVMVPLLLRSVKVADEISAAAMTRGIDSGRTRSSLRDVRLTVVDMAAALVFCLFVAALWYYDKSWPAILPEGIWR